MKYLGLLILSVAFVAADDDSPNDDIHGRTRGSSDSGSQPSTRFLGGGLGGVSPVGGFGPGPGLVPGFSPGLGSVGPGFSAGFGFNPGFGGNFGGNVGFGVNPGFSGITPGFGGVAPPSTCRYWCRTPQGQAYCCENINQFQSFAGVLKPGFCPPVRPVCPPVRNFLPPVTCSNDGACGGIDKCCFDTCLQEHVCKPPFGIGR